MQSSSNSIGSGKPFRFALKELVMPKVFPVGLDHDVRDYVPLSEAALQRYMRHPSIVDTYWADVRCLHPKTHAQLPVEVWDIADTDFESWDDAPRGGGGVCCKKKAVPARLTCVRLQLRIAMEHCDLGAAPLFQKCLRALTDKVQACTLCPRDVPATLPWPLENDRTQCAVANVYQP